MSTCLAQLVERSKFKKWRTSDKGLLGSSLYGNNLLHYNKVINCQKHMFLSNLLYFFQVHFIWCSHLFIFLNLLLLSFNLMLFIFMVVLLIYCYCI